MTRITFEEVARYGEKRGKCRCGTLRVRRRKFFQTLSPFNKVDGIPKTREQIAEELSAEIKAWQSEPILCSKCEAGVQSAAAQVRRSGVRVVMAIPCPDCKHQEHDPGRCKYDNCGSSDISHSGAIKTDRTKVVTWQSFQRSEVATRGVTHIKPPKYGK